MHFSGRTRKVKCDEFKPSCNRCKKSGWRCEYGPVKDAVRKRHLRLLQEIKLFPTTAHPPLPPSSEISPLGDPPIISQTVPLRASVLHCQPSICQPQSPLHLSSTLQVQDFAPSIPKSIEPLDALDIVLPMASEVNDEGYASGFVSENERYGATSDTSDTSSMDPSLTDYVWENGRRYHSNSYFPEILLSRRSINRSQATGDIFGHQTTTKSRTV